jgi:Lrp/AsnC family transcriptional regulator, leucine-responsive regulatory protein
MTPERKPNRRNANDELLDAVNRRLLLELQTDARLSLAELGRRVGLSAPAVGERLQRLREEGVVRGYRAELDPGALGFPLGVIMRVRPAAGELPRSPSSPARRPRWSSAIASPVRTASS